MHLIIDKAKMNTKLPKVMKAALQLFTKKGIEGTTIKDIASKARVSEGALYRHFKSKEELAWHLFITHLTDFTTDLMTQVFGQPTAEKRILAFVSECFKAFEEDRDLFTYLIISEHRELKKFPETKMHPGHVVLKIVQEGQKEGSIKKGDPYILGALFLGGIIRTCIVRMYGGIEKDLRSCDREIADHLWKMLRSE